MPKQPVTESDNIAKVVLCSEEYGIEEFEYDSKEAAFEGLGRLVKDIEQSCDPEDRTLHVVIETVRITWENNCDER